MDNMHNVHCVILGAWRFRNVRRLSPESQCCCRLSAVCSCKACHQATSKQNKVCKCEYACALDKCILVTMMYACSTQVTIHGISWPPVCSCKSCHQPSKAEHALAMQVWHIPCKSANLHELLNVQCKYSYITDSKPPFLTTYVFTYDVHHTASVQFHVSCGRNAIKSQWMISLSWRERAWGHKISPTFSLIWV